MKNYKKIYRLNELIFSVFLTLIFVLLLFLSIYLCKVKVEDSLIFVLITALWGYLTIMSYLRRIVFDHKNKVIKVIDNEYKKIAYDEIKSYKFKKIRFSTKYHFLIISTTNEDLKINLSFIHSKNYEKHMISIRNEFDEIINMNEKKGR